MMSEVFFKTEWQRVLKLILKENTNSNIRPWKYTYSKFYNSMSEHYISFGIAHMLYSVFLLKFYSYTPLQRKFQAAKIRRK